MTRVRQAFHEHGSTLGRFWKKLKNYFVHLFYQQQLSIFSPQASRSRQSSPAKMQAISRSTSSALRAASRRQAYSTATGSYAATAANLRVTKDTKVIYQGFTGKQGT